MSGTFSAVVLALAVAGGDVLGMLVPHDDARSTRDDARSTRVSASASMPLHRFHAVDIDGRTWTSDDLRGRVVLLDFWATWCAPCLAELPRLRALRSRHARHDFEIVGISVDATSRRSFVSWLNRNRVEWPQIHERAGYSGKIPRLFGIDRLPRTVVIGRNGDIAAVDIRGGRLAAVIDALVAREPLPAEVVMIETAAGAVRQK